MDQQRIIFESASGFIIACIAIGLLYAFLLYRSNHPWSKSLNNILFALRAALAFLLAFLLMGPIIRQSINDIQRPLWVILQDDSGSIKAAVDSSSLNKIDVLVNNTADLLEEQGYEVKRVGLNGRDATQVTYNRTESDINGALRQVSNEQDGENLAGTILISDGIYNSGVSPLYSTFNFPVYSLGVGDTTQHIDLSIKNIAYNRIAYQGNQFPIRTEVLAQGVSGKDVTVTLIQRGKVVKRETKNLGDNALISFDFLVNAPQEGIQSFDVQVEVLPDEYNARNNSASFFVEVVKGRKKILLTSPSPHPDVKALRLVIEANANYEFLLHIPGVAEQQIKPEEIDVAIFLQSPDSRGRTRAFMQQFLDSKASLFFVLGQQTDMQAFSRMDLPIDFETVPRDYDDITPVLNTTFNAFTLDPKVSTQLSGYPPVSVPFGRMRISPGASVLLNQRIGTLATDKPLLAIGTKNDRKIAVMLGEGMWRWRLDEYEQTEKTFAFDQLFGKLIQYLSTTDDKRRFRSFPIEQEFSESEAVVIESQVYNEIYEPVFGNTISLELTSEEGVRSTYSYTLTPGNTRYEIGGLAEGVYRYKASTEISGKTETVTGQFAVREHYAELQNLTADFGLLRKLSTQTGGKFFSIQNAQAFQENLKTLEAKSIIRTEERYEALVNIKWIFVLLLLMVGTEWFLRKYYGGY